MIGGIQSLFSLLSTRLQSLMTLPGQFSTPAMFLHTSPFSGRRPHLSTISLSMNLMIEYCSGKVQDDAMKVKVYSGAKIPILLSNLMNLILKLPSPMESLHGPN